MLIEVIFGDLIKYLNALLRSVEYELEVDDLLPQPLVLFLKVLGCDGQGVRHGLLQNIKVFLWEALDLTFH